MKTESFEPDRPSLAELTSFFSRVFIQVDGCWRWTGSVNGKGYGVYKGTSAHRFTYAWFAAPIPADHEVDHLCRFRLCVNPAHGEAVTGRENRRRANRFDLTGRCRRGHVLAVVGIGTNNIPGLDRICRQCRRIAQARYCVRTGLSLCPALATALAQENMRLAIEGRRQQRREAVAS